MIKWDIINEMNEVFLYVRRASANTSGRQPVSFWKQLCLNALHCTVAYKPTSLRCVLLPRRLPKCPHFCRSVSEPWHQPAIHHLVPQSGVFVLYIVLHSCCLLENVKLEEMKYILRLICFFKGHFYRLGCGSDSNDYVYTLYHTLTNHVTVQADPIFYKK